MGTGNPSSPIHGDIYYNSVAAKFRAYQNSTWIDLGASAAGSGTELQYRNSTTGALAAMLGSVVDTSGNLTMSGTPTFSGGFTITKSNVGVIQYLRLYESTAASSPQISVVRTRGTEGTNTAVAAGDALFSMSIFGAYGHASNRQGGELRFDTTGAFTSTSAPTVFRLKTTHLNAISPNERMVLGGALTLVDNTLTNLFSVTFAAADHKVVGGEIHMLITAKQVSGSLQTQVYHRKMHFVFGHNGCIDFERS